MEKVLFSLWFLLKIYFLRGKQVVKFNIKSWEIFFLFFLNFTPKFLPLDEKEKEISQLLNITKNGKLSFADISCTCPLINEILHIKCCVDDLKDKVYIEWDKC